jgi:hypothetical protein
VHPTLFPACLYCSYCLLLSFSFFPWWRSVCPGGYAALAQACLWEYHGTTKLTWSASSQAIRAPVTGGPGALLVSPFNVEILCAGWRCGGVKVMPFLSDYACKVCLSVSSRFHYKRLAFCFLPLAAILESSGDPYSRSCMAFYCEAGHPCQCILPFQSCQSWSFRLITVSLLVAQAGQVLSLVLKLNPQL